MAEGRVAVLAVVVGLSIVVGLGISACLATYRVLDAAAIEELRAEVRELRRSVANLTAAPDNQAVHRQRMSSVTPQASTLPTAVDDLSARIADSANESVSRQLQLALAELASQVANNTEALKLTAEVHARYQNLKNAFSTLSLRVENVTEALATCRSQSLEWKANMSTLSARLEDISTATYDGQSRLTDLDRAMADLSAKVNNNAEDIDASFLDKSAVQELSSELSRLNTRMEKLPEYEELKTRVSSLSARFDNNTRALADLWSQAVEVNSTMADLTARLDAGAKTTSICSSESLKLRSSLDALATTVDSNARGIADGRSQILDLLATITTLSDKMNSTTGNMIQTRSESTELRVLLGELATKTEALESSSQTVSELTSRQEDLKETVESLSARFDIVRNVTAARADVKQLNKTMVMLSVGVDINSKRLDKMGAVIFQLLSTVPPLSERVDDVARAAAEAQSVNMKLNSTMTVMSETVDSISQAQTGAATDFLDLKSAVIELSGRVDDNQRAVSEVRSENLRLNDSLSDLSENVYANSQTLAAATVDIMQLNATVTEASENFDNTSGELREVKAENRRRDTLVSELSGRVQQQSHATETTLELQDAVQQLQRNLANPDRLQCQLLNVTAHLFTVPDCRRVQDLGLPSGVYWIGLGDGQADFRAFCDLDTDGGPWLVFQRRMDGSVSFTRNWAEYTLGFGDLRGDFWLGLEKLHRLTSAGLTQLRVDMATWEGRTGYALYSTFQVANSSDHFRLEVHGYSGNAGDDIYYNNTEKFTANGMQFTTYDQDHDTGPGSCAQHFKAGWWYNSCHHAHPNGVYGSQGEAGGQYIKWSSFYNNKRSLKLMEMKIK